MERFYGYVVVYYCFLRDSLYYICERERDISFAGMITFRELEIGYKLASLCKFFREHKTAVTHSTPI